MIKKSLNSTSLHGGRAIWLTVIKSDGSLLTNIRDEFLGFPASGNIADAAIVTVKHLVFISIDKYVPVYICIYIV